MKYTKEEAALEYAAKAKYDELNDITIVKAFIAGVNWMIELHKLSFEEQANVLIANLRKKGLIDDENTHSKKDTAL